MAPASLLPVEPGDKVLDLCAAPGGKSTELAAKLQGEGLLFSNDISNSRAKALLKNLELAGAGNICVSSETPEKLARYFEGFFDKILVDAPCSGEGMFLPVWAAIFIAPDRPWNVPASRRRGLSPPVKVSPPAAADRRRHGGCRAPA